MAGGLHMAALYQPTSLRLLSQQTRWASTTSTSYSPAAARLNCVVSPQRKYLPCACALASSRDSTRGLSSPSLPNLRDVESPVSLRTEAFHALLKSVVAVGASLSLLLNGSPVLASPSTDAVQTALSPSIEVAEAQKTIVEAWTIVKDNYVDTTFNHQDWDRKLQDALKKAAKEKTASDVFKDTRELLASLGDPYTRIVSPQDFRNFRIRSNGHLEGVGLLISMDPITGRLVVVSPIEGGPAERAGIRTGDALVQIDGVSLEQVELSRAVERLRGKPGTTVTLKIFRQAEDGGFLKEPIFLELTREAVSLSPVFASLLEDPTHISNEKMGYIRISTFNENAAVEVQKAVQKLRRNGAAGFILDLRDNPGGLVAAGLDIAEMWLKKEETIFNTVDRWGEIQPITAQHGSSKIMDVPLVVLVNSKSASASEILAGALHDNGRAMLVGQTTFGKGKMQSVYELHDGSGLFVTVAKYLSPALHPIDKVGIIPDTVCTPENNNLPADIGAWRPTANVHLLEQIKIDNCVVAAEKQLLALADG